jgi:dTDP-4-amino-4,6-dideoxygalactose transaminase
MDIKLKMKPFSGKPEDFPNFRYDFEDSMELKGISKLLDTSISVEDRKRLENFEAKNRKLWSYLSAALDERSKDHIRRTITQWDGLTAWDAIIKLHVRTDHLKMDTLRSQYMNLTLEENGDVDIYFSELHKLKREIRNGSSTSALPNAFSANATGPQKIQEEVSAKWIFC